MPPKKGDLAPCLITGELTIPVATAPSVKGLRAVGGHASGDALICFDKPAFCSYGLKQAANAPVSETAMGAVKAALDELISDAPILCGMKFGHWYDRDIEKPYDPFFDDNFFGLGFGGDEEPEEENLEETELQARKNADRVINAVYGGDTAPILDAIYHILLLSGVGGRVMVRRYEMGEYENLRNNLAQLNQDLKQLERQGYKYIFIDEVTLMEDFIEGAALLSDIFAACGMKIVLSGKDSLGFLFAAYNELYDRCIRLHTTHIPYREFEEILGIRGIDEYIRYGGTMSLGGVHYNETSTFASKKSADEYVDSAIARNIQHSLECYDNQGHFRHLAELYEQGELTSAINRIVEDITHRFTLEVLTRDFASNDYRLSARNLRRDRAHPTDILDRIDIPAFTERLRTLMEIRNQQEQTVQIKDIHRSEIKEYLDLLDLTSDIEVRSLPAVNDIRMRTVIAQPGLRYAQADALIQSLLLDETFSDLSLEERNFVTERILNEIKGRMMEDIVLLETKLANPKKEVFVLQFAIGEFDMVVFDPAAGSCEIYEIKHSTEAVPQQYRHLIDEQKCELTRHRFGPITGKFVLYRGADMESENGIQYRNVEAYLMDL